MHGGFEVWLLNGCGPNLCFPKAFEQSTRFPRRKSNDMSHFRGKNYRRSAHINMLTSTTFLLVLGRPCPSSKRPYSMCVHAKAKTRN